MAKDLVRKSRLARASLSEAISSFRSNRHFIKAGMKLRHVKQAVREHAQWAHAKTNARVVDRVNGLKKGIGTKAHRANMLAQHKAAMNRSAAAKKAWKTMRARGGKKKRK